MMQFQSDCNNRKWQHIPVWQNYTIILPFFTYNHHIATNTFTVDIILHAANVTMWEPKIHHCKQGTSAFNTLTMQTQGYCRRSQFLNSVIAFEQHNLHEAERKELCLSLDHRRKAQKLAPLYLYFYHSASNVCSWTLHLVSLSMQTQQ